MRLPTTPLPQAAAFFFSVAAAWANPGEPVDYTRRNETFIAAVALAGDRPPVNESLQERRAATPSVAETELSPRASERASLDGQTPRPEVVIRKAPRVFPRVDTPMSPLNGRKSMLQPRREGVLKSGLGSDYQSRLSSAQRVKIGRISADDHRVALEQLNRFVSSSNPPPSAPATVPATPAGAGSAPLP